MMLEDTGYAGQVFDLSFERNDLDFALRMIEDFCAVAVKVMI